MTTTAETSDLDLAPLAATGQGRVLRPADPGYHEEVATFNVANVHQAPIVVAATSFHRAVPADDSRCTGGQRLFQTSGSAALETLVPRLSCDPALRIAVALGAERARDEVDGCLPG